MRTPTVTRFSAAVLAGVVGAAFVGVGAASAHVTVNPREATQGGYAKLAFRVPNEKDNASTVKLEVVLPANTPIASVSVRPTAGWTAEVEKTKLATPLKVHDSEITEAPSKITWTAANADVAVKPGQFQEFEISGGPLPEVDKIVFKALQTYSSGEVVRWIEEPGADGKEPGHPAPVLKLTKAGAGNGNTGAGNTPADTHDDDASVKASDDSHATTGWALGFGIAGLVAGLAALAVALLGRRRASSPPAA